MAARKSLLRRAPERPELDRLFAESRDNPPDNDQLLRQRVSFAYGNAPTDVEGITKKTVDDSSRRVRISEGVE